MTQGDRTILATTAMLLIGVNPGVAQGRDAAHRTTTEVIDASHPEEWRALDPENTLVLEFATGRVVVELAPRFAPRHVNNIRALVRGGYFDGGAVNRSQDNYVVQWSSRRLAEGEAWPAEIAGSLEAEFEIDAAGIPFTPIPDGDVYAPEAGFSWGFPVGRDPATGRAWAAHCYGMVGVARGNDPDSGNGAALYVVIGHAPRHLDRNLTMVGRVVDGMEHLSILPRGGAPLGRYESSDERVPIRSASMASDRTTAPAPSIEILRTDSRSFSDLILAARSRHEDFFVEPTDRIDLCNVRVPSRPPPGS